MQHAAQMRGGLSARLCQRDGARLHLTSMNDLVDVLVRYGYRVVFGWVFAEQIGLPIPAMPVLLAAGAIAGTGRLSLVLVSAGISLVRERRHLVLDRSPGRRPRPR
jgi:hypothetical protein